MSKQTIKVVAHVIARTDKIPEVHKRFCTESSHQHARKQDA
ncbi:hypothetical protein [Nitrosomonas oligotropha]|uniref:Uncharacterized protein n=1 Tax=Nitrosomonas oligotropha TaxID=42354 RepID=A0A1H8QDH6_9PROT|nr:hypothetical protein [Nitrosomonas oligotropha]SDW73149.1 hypothetical protein SAMN05216300_10994 [Nitrosomonas oligotropha]SEO52290.1 hypothetical protein SAMN05216333_11193 [Nitrosomonas oligotropha]